MCGIAGFLSGQNGASAEALSERLRGMTRTLVHRGPDDEGLLVDVVAGLALGHRRLSIVDLSETGHQPMLSGSGRFAIVFNGEIYNHLELRQALPEVRFRGHSDTESLLAGFDRWGIDETLRRSRGMFAFAVWDKREQVLTVARDRLGEKPLFYGWLGSGSTRAWAFASELKALRAHPAFGARLDPAAVSAYTRYAYVPAPLSIYQGIRKLNPGELRSISALTLQEHSRTYWRPRDVFAACLTNPFRGTDDEAALELEQVLDSAVSSQMVADVPLGAFLSGGIDSSMVVALMQKNSTAPVRTFTIGFDDAEFDEARHARDIARHLGTDHTELYVSPEEALKTVPALHTMYDEPFADSSQIPTYLVSRLARSEVTVALSGDGGDELFGGYNRYWVAETLWPRLNVLPTALRRAAATAIAALPARIWQQLARSTPFPSGTRLIDRVQKGTSILRARTVDELYETLVSQSPAPHELLKDGCSIRVPNDHDLPHGLSPSAQMMALDMLTYLPDDILAKVDRAAMAVSLETRVPFLDHDVVEFAWRLPTHMKIRTHGRRVQSKWLLRKILYKYVPPNLIDRPKMGFSIPLATWLRGPLRSWADDLLSAEALDRVGFFDPKTVAHAWSQHRRGERNRQHELWDILMFQAWHLNTISR